MSTYTIDKIEYGGDVYRLQDSVSDYITGIDYQDVVDALGYTPTDNVGTVTSITLTQGTGISINSSGVAITNSGSRTISLATITKSDSTSTVSPAHGETFTAIDSITYDTYGRVTGVNTKTITLPADSNTDTLVTQTNTTNNLEYRLLFSANANDNDETDISRKNTYLRYKPNKRILVNGGEIRANKGVFNELVATTLKADSATITDLETTNATVVGLLDVQGEMHTNQWTNANIANIGGSFYITPTIEPTSSQATISIIHNSATNWTITITGTFATNTIKTGTSISGVDWSANSLIVITGDVVVDNMTYPLGTLKGTLNEQVTATAAGTSKIVTLTGVTDGQGNTTPAILQRLYELNNNTNISNATFTNGKISLYQIGSYPVGIQMSSMGIDANSMIEIYGGVSTDPTVRVGHLAGLSPFNVNNKTTVTPTGWGIYTDNGFFKGVIAATSGIIGGFDIGQTDLHNGTLGGTNSVWVSTGTSGTSGSAIIGGSELINNWAFTAGNKFGVTQDGTLYAQNANIEGAITATSLTIGGGASSYDAINAMNAAGYTIEIINDISAAPIGTIITDGSTYLYPIMYHNGVRVGGNEIINTQYTWYRGSSEIGEQGDASKGGIVANYGYTYRVAYSFDDGEVGQAPSVQQVLVDPQKYITRISDTGITIHPEDISGHNFLQINANGFDIVKNNSVIASYGTDITIGSTNGKNIFINSNGIQIKDGQTLLANFSDTITIGSNNGKNIFINNSGIQIRNISTILTKFETNEIQLGANNASRILINTNGLTIYKDSTDVAQFGSTARIGASNSARFLINNNSLQAYDNSATPIKYFEVSEDGLSWGNNTAATTTQVNAAAQTASSYIAYIDDINGIKVASSNPYNASNYVQITSDAINLVGGGVSKATVTSAGMDLYINPNNTYNGTCNSSYGAYTKEVYINFFPSTLTVGTEVFITFVNGSTTTSGSHDYDKVTLKINYGEKKEIRDVNNLDSLWNKTISKGSICHFIYNGTYWVYQGLASGSKIASFTGNGINLYKNNRLAGYIRLQEYSFGLYFDDDDIDLYNGYDYGISFRGYKIDPTVNNGFSAYGYVSVATPNPTTPESNSDANLLLNARAYNTDTYISLYSNVTDTGRIVTYIEASQSITVTSDERLKTDFEPINQLSDLILELNPIEYHWINKQTDTKHFGFKAQEVQKSLKKFNINNTNYALVGENTQGYLNIAYEEFIPLMIDVIQKQEKRISKLEAQLEGGLN